MDEEKIQPEIEEDDGTKPARACEVETRLYDDDGNILFDMKKLPDILLEKSNCIDKYAWIIHNQDVYSEEEEEKDPKYIAGSPKPDHIHLLLHFKRNQPQRYKHVAGWFGLAANFVSRIRKKWENAVLYLVHLNAPEKFQYDANDIKANFNVKAVINHADSRAHLDYILEQILSGKIREYNKTREINQLTLVHHAREINEAFKTYSTHLQATQQERSTEVVFITGRAGSGKTTLAKRIAAEQKLDYFVSSSNNDILDGYAQQPCVILDDIRPDSLGISDLLKLLDNHTASTIKSRYRNKFLCAELIILTSVLNIEEFHQNIYGHEHEPIEQLKRRCGTYIEIESNGIIISRWDNTIRQYIAPTVFKNDIISQYIPPAPKKREEVYGEIQNLVPFLTQATLPDDVQQRMTKPPKTDETAPDDVYLKLMPLDKGGVYDG